MVGIQLTSFTSAVFRVTPEENELEREGGREGRREGGRERGREGGREGGRVGGTEGTGRQYEDACIEMKGRGKERERERREKEKREEGRMVKIQVRWERN